MLFKAVRISECCLEYNFGDAVSTDVSNKALRVYHYLCDHFDRSQFPITDILPTYTGVAVHFPVTSPLFYDSTPLQEAVVLGLESHEHAAQRKFVVDVIYDGADVGHVCRTLCLNRRKLIALHSQRPYTIAMLGFRPCFPYLLGLDDQLHIARRENPRLSVRKGSVAIAAGQTGIYSEDSPGGWHIIAHTDFDDFDKLRPGDSIEFREM